ncbi:hypothetical protein M3Q_2642 [Acinetobacter baumannii TYTH-1]|nr:hypothetical protein M3Q_2642 [Acinetobacter baumannii TYTH-1]
MQLGEEFEDHLKA